MLSVTKIEIYTTRGANKRPNSGTVSFSDGKHYDWGLDLEGDICFYAARRRMVHNERVMFRSVKRAALVQAILDSDDCPSVTVFTVVL